MANESFLKKYNMGVKIANVKLILKSLKIIIYSKNLYFIKLVCLHLFWENT